MGRPWPGWPGQRAAQLAWASQARGEPVCPDGVEWKGITAASGGACVPTGMGRRACQKDVKEPIGPQYREPAVVGALFIAGLASVFVEAVGPRRGHH